MDTIRYSFIEGGIETCFVLPTNNKKCKPDKFLRYSRKNVLVIMSEVSSNTIKNREQYWNIFEIDREKFMKWLGEE